MPSGFRADAPRSINLPFRPYVPERRGSHRDGGDAGIGASVRDPYRSWSERHSKSVGKFYERNSGSATQYM